MSDNLRVLHGEIDHALGTKIEVFEPLNVQRLTAGSFTLHMTGTEVLLILQSAIPLVDKGTNTITGQSIQKPEALISISPGTAKDLSILLAQAVAQHEETVGPIVTPFTTQREGPVATARPAAD